jgi:hypothetical protein
MRYFCTYFDSNYLHRGLALHESLCAHAGDFALWVLCFDQTTFELLNRLHLPSLHTIRREDFESAYPALLSIKATRSPVEYYLTTTPLLPRYVLDSQPQVNRVAYVDADLFFYGDLRPIYEEWASGSIYIVPHRFPFPPKAQQRSESDGGIYNVGFVGFRRDSCGLACLERWAQQCLEWCYLRTESGRLGDQKYLDDWPQRYPGVVVSENPGVGAGGWNIWAYRIRQRDGEIYLNGHQLIMLHVNFVEVLSARFLVGIPRWSLRPIYRPYAASLSRAIQSIRQVAPGFQLQHRRIPPWEWLARGIRGGIVAL